MKFVQKIGRKKQGQTRPSNRIEKADSREEAAEEAMETRR